MSAHQHLRGHPITYTKNGWVYDDTQEPITDNERPCIKCRHLPTKEGHDHCLGYIPELRSACCGHGKEPSYIVLENGLHLNSRFNFHELKTQI